MALALLACGITLFAWFSPALLHSGEYGFAPVLALVGVHLTAALFMMTGILIALKPRLERA